MKKDKKNNWAAELIIGGVCLAALFVGIATVFSVLDPEKEKRMVVDKQGNLQIEDATPDAHS
jgi:hypothetical protein